MRRPLLLAFAIALTPVLAMADTITGTVTYLQRIVLPPDAVLEVDFQDVSRADAPARTLATYRMENLGTPPYPFAFQYDPAWVDEAISYRLRATVHEGDQLLMTTDTAYPVLTRGAGVEVEMVLKPVAPKPDSDFINTYWKLLTLDGEAVPVSDNQPEPNLMLRVDGTYNATVGCNMIRGTYKADDATVSFGPGMMTRKACLPPLDRLEQSLARTLGAATGHRIKGENLDLLDASGKVLATFRAVYM